MGSVIVLILGIFYCCKYLCYIFLLWPFLHFPFLVTLVPLVYVSLVNGIIKSDSLKPKCFYHNIKQNIVFSVFICIIPVDQRMFSKKEKRGLIYGAFSPVVEDIGVLHF